MDESFKNLVLSEEDKKYIQKIYQKVLQKQSILSQSMLKGILQKSGNVKEEDLAQFMIQQSIKFSNSESQNMNKLGFFILMKYLGQYQGGINVKNIDIMKLKNTILPKFTSKKVQDKIDRKTESQLMLSNLQSNLMECGDEEEESKQQYSKANNINSYNQLNKKLAMNQQEQRYPTFANKEYFQQIEDNTYAQNNQNIDKKQVEIKKDEDKFIQQFDDQNKEYYNANISLLKSINMATMNDQSMNCFNEKKKSRIFIKGFEVKKGSLLSKNYVVFLIDSGQIVERRYTQFEELDCYFLQKKESQGRIIPKIPPKEYSLSQLIGTQVNDNEFLNQRMNDLEDYLNRINQISYLSEDPVFKQFITDENNFQIPEQYQKSLFSQVGEMFQSIKNHNFQENSEYFSAYISQKFNEYYNQDTNHLIDTKDIDEIMVQINAYSKEVDHLQQIFYHQYQLENQKHEKIQSIQSDEQSLESIFLLEKNLLIHSNNFDQISKLKKSIWKEFRSISLQTDGAKQAHDQLIQQIRNQHFLNHLRAKKNSRTEKDNLDLKQMDTEIQQSEEVIKKTKALLKEELQIFLNNLKKRIREALENYKNQTINELQIDNQ